MQDVWSPTSRSLGGEGICYVPYGLHGGFSAEFLAAITSGNQGMKIGEKVRQNLRRIFRLCREEFARIALLGTTIPEYVSGKWVYQKQTPLS